MHYIANSPIDIANNAFKRAAYGLIDYFLEAEKEMRMLAEAENWDEKVLETRLDKMWGQVTLYNTYQLFVQLTAKKESNPSIQFTKDANEGKYEGISDEEYDALLKNVTALSNIWDQQPEADQLSLFFSATDKLPVNSMRRLVSNANNALKAIAGADKMLASVYGIAITAMVVMCSSVKAGAQA